MAYNRVNKYALYLRVAEIVKAHHVEGLTTLKGVYDHYVYPVYPISYGCFLRILREPNLRSRYEEERRRVGYVDEPREDNQLKLF